MANVFGFKEPPAFWIAKNISQTGYVTLDTAQTITGYKTFDVDISCNYTIYCQNLVASNNLSATAITATTIYPTQVVFPDNTVQTTAYSATANQVLVTDTLNTTGYLVFAQNAFTGQNSLYMDSTSPRKLTYNPNNGNLYSTSSSIGAESTINPSNSTVRQQSGAPSEIINNATNGSFNFYLSDNFNNQVQVLNMNATGSTFQKQLILGGTGADSQITCVFHSLKDNTLNTNQGLIYCDNGWFLYDNNANGGRHRFTNNTSGGVQTVPLDFGSTFMTIDITNPPTCTAPQPASNDSSNKIPTTAWVQAAIAAAVPPTVPVGTIMFFGGNSAPSGYLLCQGQIIDSLLYPQLFAVIGNKYNGYVPVPPGYFVVPDFRGVYPGMPGSNATSLNYPPLTGVSLSGPSALGAYQVQQTVFVDHQHTSDYPSNTGSAVAPGSTSFYKSGSPQQNYTTTANNLTAPNAYTTIGDILRPTTLGVNYIIKYL